MNNQLQSLVHVLFAAKNSGTTQQSTDTFAIIMLVLILLFFLWLLIAVIRKLSKPAGRLGEMKEDEAEAARTARLWAEAKRKSDEEEQEEQEEEQEFDLQSELVEKAKQRRQEKRQADEVAQKFRQAALRASEPKPEQSVTEPEQSVSKPEQSVTEPEQSVSEPEQPVSEPEQPVTEPEQSVSEPEQPVSRIDSATKPVPASKPKSLEDGLAKTRTGFVARLSSMFGSKALDDEELEEIEEILFTADIGVKTAQKLLEFIETELSKKDRSKPEKILDRLQEKIHSMLSLKAKPLDFGSNKPLVILVVGVNGTGKTTTIGKLAMRFTSEGKKVILAAGDTFRAAAAEQLEIWANRTGSQLIRGQEGGDPGAVVFDAISAAKSQNADLVIADTAGRLHTKVNLVEELRKIQRVCGKALPGAPHEVWLVLDATTGQNAINQAKQFHKALELSGIVLTKLDGTAKGGVIIGITDTFGIPVRYIGIGEQAEDLRKFDAEAFVKALFT